MKQIFENLPSEILDLPRFVQSGNHGDPKAPFDGWNRPENQNHFSALDLDKPFGIVAATERDDSLIFFDFDHVLDDDGNFISEEAERWFNYLHAEEYFCELSTSKHGLHMFAAPTVGKFTGGRRELKLGNGAKLEIFYGTNKFCLVTGTTFRCEPCAPIAQGDVADQMFQIILDAVKKQSAPKEPARTESHHMPDTTEFNSFRARRMLDTIDPAALSYDEWLTVLSCCKNIGIDYATFDAWNSRDTSLSSNGKPRYNEPENLSHWNSNINATFGFNQLYTIAVQFGYDAKAVWQEWQETKPRPVSKQLGTFANAEHQADVMNATEPKSKEEIIANIRNQCEWKHDSKDRRTTIKPTQANLDLIFENDPNLRGLFGYDQFQGATVLLKQAPWHDEDRTGDQWTDADDAELRIYIRRNYAELEHKQRIEDSVINFANRNAFHPVKKFFKNLPRWDGIPRAETLFIKFLRVTDTAYARAVTMNWLTAAVARIFKPGCNYQCALTLCGAQGIGKSYLAERLGGKWYGAIIDDVSDPHAVDALQSIWIGEVKEMSGMRKDINANKSFIERAVDIRRGAYEKRATPRPRHCVFYISVNDAEFLRDVTGNRRYLILQCNSRSLDYVDGLTDEFISQLWAEVYQHYCELFKDGFDDKKLALSREIQREAEDIAQNYLQDDGLTTEIKSFLDKRLPPAVIWRLMSKEERRKFFADGCITFTESTLNHRRRGQGGRSTNIQRDIDGIYTLLHSQHGTIQKIELGTETSYRFYGSELREHICAAEIFNEAFSNGDKRKLMYRINEILSQLDGWHLGKRLQKADPEYLEQKKPFYRGADNRPADEDNEICNRSELYGEHVDPNDTPF